MAAEAAVSFAVETLGNLLIEKAVFLRGVKGEVEWLRDELKRLQCFLKDAGKKQSDSDSIRHWISEIREVSHDAQDTIDLFILNVQSRGLLERYTCFPNHLYHLNKVGEKIESIKKKLKEVEESRRALGIQNLDECDRQRAEVSATKVERRRRLVYWENDKHVVGLEKDVELLLKNAILEKGHRLSVAAILGMGGIGKSTLSIKIYNHPAVIEQFHHRAWVVVSSEFTPEDIIKQIMPQMGISYNHKVLDSIKSSLGREEYLKRELHKGLEGKRYFIVLDDVWEAIHWESLSGAFPNQGTSSRLLLTSRNQVMRRHCEYVHNMKVLDISQSWKLFLRKAFPDNVNHGCPEELKNTAKEILEKCGGLPLAISVVGGLLAKKRKSKKEWEKVLKEMKYHFGRSGDIDTISAILELSYHNLASELKACFLCLGFFKQDAVIEMEDLVQIWVALGLVGQEVVGEGETMEDVAREYSDELISRHMLQVKVIEYDLVQFCHVHDLLHDLAIRKAREEINFEVMREEGNSHDQSLDKPRHRAIQFSGSKFVYSTSRNQYLRSLFIHGETPYAEHGGPSTYWKSFELLRVLDLGNEILKVLPKAIGMLTGLRYFKMRYKGRRSRLLLKIKRSRLPRSWANLKNLQVLDIGCYGMLIVIDRVVLNMSRLRHLYARVDYSTVGLGKMRSLRTLNSFRIKDSDLWQIQGMDGVSLLAFDMTEMFDAGKLFTYLATLGNLDCLILVRYQNPLNMEDSVSMKEPLNIDEPLKMEGFSSLHRLTRLYLDDFCNMRWLPHNFPPNLSYLSLARLPLSIDPMSVLENLSELLYLKLSKAYIGEDMVISRDGFPSLKVLHLEHMPELINMKIEEGAMPELNQLIIHECPNLKIQNLPEHLKSVIMEAN